MAVCNWFLQSSLTQEYHDLEWGGPVHDDRKMFEYILMECMSCGLSWTLMLVKRKIFKKCFARFDFEKVARFTDADVERILKTPGMIRSERKIRAMISNAKCFLKVREEYGSFSDYLWSFTGGKTFVYRSYQNGKLDVRNEISDKIARELKRRGFKYLGSVTLYSHLQGVGIFNAHDLDCPCYRKLLKISPTRIFK